MKIRGFYTRNKDLKFISHLNTVDLLQRAIFYTNAKIKFSEGFNVHPKMSFGNPLPLGVSSDFEVFDIELDEKVNIKDFINKINEYLPSEVQIFKGIEVTDNSSISKIFNHSIYEFFITTNINLENVKLDFNDELIIERKKKSKNKKHFIYIEEDISDYVEVIEPFKKVDDNTYKLICKLENSHQKIINPQRFIEGVFKKYNLDISIYDVSINKKEMI